MQKLLLPLLLVLSSYVFAQSKLVGFSSSGEINAPNSGGMIWEMNPDGSAFQVLRNFHIQKPLRPVGEMVVGPDGHGYGFAGGYDIDAGVQVFYQYNFITKDLSILKVFNDSPFAAKLLVGTDGVLYASRRVSISTRAVCKISLEGAVIEDIYQFEYSGTTTGMTQTPDGRIILTCEKYGEGPLVIGGFADGTDWKTLISFEYDALGNYLSNLVPKSDGYLYGVTWEYWGAVRFFRFLQNGQDFSYFHETTAPTFGNQISLNLDANEVLYALTQKSTEQVLYIIPTDGNTTPTVLFEDGAHGHLRSNLTRDEAGNLYYQTSRLNAGSQMAYLLKLKNGVSVAPIISLYLSSDQDWLSPILFNPSNSRLYFWKSNDHIQLPKMMSCKTDGTSLLTEYNLITGIPSVGASPQKLIQGSNGKYYGLLGKGGQNGTGLLFSMNPDGSAFNIMAQMLPAQVPITWWPEELISCLFEGSDGYLYGTVGDGRIFKIDKNGNGFTVLHDQLHHRSNFIESTDGMLYWGGNSLMRMAKDGTNKSVVLANFISPYSYYDFCELFQLPDGKIAGAGSYTEDANCLDYYTYPFCFTYDPNNQTLQKTSSYYSRIGNTLVGQDGILYFGKGKYNPESNLVTPLNLGCAFFPDLPSNYQIAAPALEGSSGFLFGRKTASNSNDGRWLPMAWSKGNGACEMSIPWDVSLGNHGVFAFEKTTASTPTLQPDLTEKIMLTPNPTSTSTQLSVALEAPTELHLLVLDVLGRSVFESDQNRAEGTQTFEIPASALLTKGVYHVVLKSETSTWSRLLLVQ